MSTSLVDHLRAAGFELRTTEQVATKAGFGHLEHPHQCRGCGSWVEGRKLDEHEQVCARPDVLREYRQAKSRLAHRSAHKRFHVRRGVVKPNCQFCRRERARGKAIGA